MILSVEVAIAPANRPYQMTDICHPQLKGLIQNKEAGTNWPRKPSQRVNHFSIKGSNWENHSYGQSDSISHARFLVSFLLSSLFFFVVVVGFTILPIFI